MPNQNSSAITRTNEDEIDDGDTHEATRVAVEGGKRHSHDFLAINIPPLMVAYRH